MSGLIADASVMAAVIFKEPEEERASQLLAGSDVHAPVLLVYELASICRTKIVRYPELEEHFLAALEDLAELEIVWEEVDATGVVRLALATGLSTYDTSYLFLSRSLDMPLITFDRKLAAVAAGTN